MLRKTFEGFFKNAADFGRSWATRLSISSSMFLSFARRESRGKNLGLLGSSMLEWPTELAKKTLPVWSLPSHTCTRESENLLYMLPCPTYVRTNAFTTNSTREWTICGYIGTVTSVATDRQSLAPYTLHLAYQVERESHESWDSKYQLYWYGSQVQHIDR